MMPEIASTPEIAALIAGNAAVAIGVSGGKDSQAAAIAVMRHLDAYGHAGPRILIHADLGVVEWQQSLPVCERLAADLGIELIVVRRNAGDLMDRWEARWQSSVRRYEDLSTVTLVPCWSTPAMRFCTSELKTHVIAAELKHRFPGQPIINVTGVRRDESSARAKGSIASADSECRIWSWRPISDWTLSDVFARIVSAGMAPHQAYTDFGLSRVSCMFCIMSGLPDLRAAAAQPEAQDLFRRMVRLEAVSTFAFQGSRWLGDIKPEILTDAERTALSDGKFNALKRIAIETRVTKAMRYVKGWPTRMLTDAEADALADVRSELTELFGFQSQFLTRDAIHERYRSLMSERARRVAA